MQLNEVNELIEATSPADAEKLIQAGWTLIAITTGDRYEHGQHRTGPIYVLGQPKPQPKMATSLNMRFP